MFPSSLPARVDPWDWLDEELPVLSRRVIGGVPDRPDFGGFAVLYSPVAELDVMDVAQRVGVTTSPAADTDWDVELSGDIGNFTEIHICQNKLNR
jgi:hypothetical protein